jgi:hypothetical protein
MHLQSVIEGDALQIIFAGGATFEEELTGWGGDDRFGAAARATGKIARGFDWANGVLREDKG